MGTPTVVVATATRVETRAAIAALQGRARVVRVGVGVGGEANQFAGAGVVLSVGLCGALDDRLEPGDAVIPDVVGDESGKRYDCDRAMTALLRSAATAAGVRVHAGPLLTVERMAVGGRRATLAREGAQAADMETARIAALGVAIAAVRVVLDTPQREIDPRWERPWQALLHPGLWPQAWRLRVEGPEYARRAARIAAAVVG